MGTSRTELDERLQRIILLGEDEWQAAELADWDRVEVLEKERQQRIYEAFIDGVAEQDVEWVRVRIAEIKAVEVKILRLAEASRSEAAVKLRQMQKGNKATKAYQQIS